MAGFTFSPKNSHAISTSHKLCSSRAVFIAVGLILLELGFLTGRMTINSSITTTKGMFLRKDDTPTAVPKPVEARIDNTPPGKQPVAERRTDKSVAKKSHDVDASQRLKSRLPLSLRSICPVTRDAPQRDYYLRHKFSQPLLMHMYMRLKKGNGDLAELVLITTGVSMGTFERNFEAAGCQVGNHVYPADTFKYDRTICTVPREIKPGTPVTLVLHKDDALKKAMKRPVKIAKGFVAEIEDGDLEVLDRDAVLHGKLEDYGYEELVPIRSKVVYQHQMDAYDPSEYRNIPRYELCVATQIRPSINLLPDWIDYHRRLGFDFIYIFDNDAEEDLSKLYAHRHDMEVVYWPWEKSQIQSFTYSVFAMRARCEWLFLMDTDEYIMVGLGDDDHLSKRDLPPMKDYVKRKEAEGYSQIWFHWVVMKNSGFITPPPQPVPEVYINRADPQINPERGYTLGKTMIQMDKSWVNANAHARQANEPLRSFNDKSCEMYPSQPWDTAMIVHYQTRSWEEYQDKLRFGRANINNPAVYSELLRRDRRARDEKREQYMLSSKKKSKIYTHFRGIWRRVKKELKAGPSVTVRYKGDQRCRTFYDLSRDNFAEPLGEECVKDV